MLQILLYSLWQCFPQSLLTSFKTNLDPLDCKFHLHNLDLVQNQEPDVFVKYFYFQMLQNCSHPKLWDDLAVKHYLILFEQLDSLPSDKFPFNSKKLVLPVILVLFDLSPLHCLAVPLLPVFVNYYSAPWAILSLRCFVYWSKFNPLLSISFYKLWIFFLKTRRTLCHSFIHSETSTQLDSFCILGL